MVNQLTCAELRDLAPELVFGLLDGASRVDALAHVTNCAECRSHVAELTRTADALLLIGPEAEPPAGFEAMVQARLRKERPRQPARWQPFAAAAAAIGVIALSLGLYAGRATAPEQALRRAAIVGEAGQVGEVYLHQEGDVSWCYVQLARSPHDGEYDVLATLRDGRVVPVQRVAVEGGRGYYGKPLQVDADDIVRMTLESTNGRWSYWADLSS